MNSDQVSGIVIVLDAVVMALRAACTIATDDQDLARALEILTDALQRYRALTENSQQ